MKPLAHLTQYGCLAQKFWENHLPKMYAELTRTGRLEQALTEAEARTAQEVDDLARHFRQQGLTPEQAEQRAWEIVQYRYVYLRPEN